MTNATNNQQVATVDMEAVLKAVKNNPNSYQTLPDDLKQNAHLVQAALNGSWKMLQFVPESCKSEKVVREAVMRCGHALQHAPATFRNNRAMVLAAIKNSTPDAINFQYASDELKQDIEFVSVAIAQNVDIYPYIPRAFLNDVEFAMKLVQRNGTAFVALPSSMKQNTDIIKAAINSDWKVIQHVPKSAKTEDIMKFALDKCGNALPCVSRDMRNNKELVLGLVQKDGLCLQYASAKLRSDIDVIAAAVKQNPTANKFSLGTS
jgi:predicted regulator of amino acid metabolism with ACT domain